VCVTHVCIAARARHNTGYFHMFNIYTYYVYIFHIYIYLQIFHIFIIVWYTYMYIYSICICACDACAYSCKCQHNTGYFNIFDTHTYYVYMVHIYMYVHIFHIHIYVHTFHIYTPVSYAYCNRLQQTLQQCVTLQQTRVSHSCTYLSYIFTCVMHTCTHIWCTHT